MTRQLKKKIHKLSSHTRNKTSNNEHWKHLLSEPIRSWICWLQMSENKIAGAWATAASVSSEGNGSIYYRSTRETADSWSCKLAGEQMCTMQGIHILLIRVLNRLYITPLDDCPELSNSFLLYQWGSVHMGWNVTVSQFKLKRLQIAKLLIIILAVHIDTQVEDVGLDCQPSHKDFQQISNTVKCLFWCHLKKFTISLVLGKSLCKIWV